MKVQEVLQDDKCFSRGGTRSNASGLPERQENPPTLDNPFADRIAASKIDEESDLGIDAAFNLVNAFVTVAMTKKGMKRTNCGQRSVILCYFRGFLICM